MNKNELVSHVAAEMSATRATAERMVGVVFSAIGDALARDAPAAAPVDQTRGEAHGCLRRNETLLRGN